MTDVDRFLLSRVACFVSEEEEVKNAFCIQSSKYWGVIRQRKTRDPTVIKKGKQASDDDRFLFSKRDDRKVYTADCVALAAALNIDTVQKMREFLVMPCAEVEAVQVDTGRAAKQTVSLGLTGGRKIVQLDMPWPRMQEFIERICAELAIVSQ